MRQILNRVIRQLRGRPFHNAAHEAQFRLAYRQSGIRMGYLFSWMAAMSFAVFSLVEYFVYLRPMTDPVQQIRAGLIIFFSIVGWHAKVKTHLYEKNFDLIVFGLQVIYVCGVLFFEYGTQIPGRAEFFYLSICSMCILLTISCYCFMRLSRSLAIRLAALFAMATFLTVYVSKVFDVTVVGRMMTYIAVANIVGFSIRQIFDMRERRIFLQTKRLKNVAALRQRLMEAETAASRAKTNFLAMLSHEIRTPMNTIVRLVELMQQDLCDQLTEKRLKSFRSVSQSCDQLLSTFDDMLEFAQLGNASNRLVIKNEAFSLPDLMRECVELVRHKADEKGISLELNTEGVSDARLMGDSHRLGRLVLNLVANAIKFTNAGGVSIVAKGKDDGPCVGLSIDVIDTGVGIPECEQTKIFQPFYQVDGSYTRKYGGSGLGLAICAQIVEAMNGSIGLNSEPGKGSRFTISLSLDKAPIDGSNRRGEFIETA
jgi:signal transduction histidine kinase